MEPSGSTGEMERALPSKRPRTDDGAFAELAIGSSEGNVSWEHTKVWEEDGLCSDMEIGALSLDTDMLALALTAAQHWCICWDNGIAASKSPKPIVGVDNVGGTEQTAMRSIFKVEVPDDNKASSREEWPG